LLQSGRSPTFHHLPLHVLRPFIINTTNTQLFLFCFHVSSCVYRLPHSILSRLNARFLLSLRRRPNLPTRNALTYLDPHLSHHTRHCNAPLCLPSVSFPEEVSRPLSPWGCPASVGYATHLLPFDYHPDPATSFGVDANQHLDVQQRHPEYLASILSYLLATNNHKAWARMLLQPRRRPLLRPVGRYCQGLLPR